MHAKRLWEYKVELTVIILRSRTFFNTNFSLTFWQVNMSSLININIAVENVAIQWKDGSFMLKMY